MRALKRRVLSNDEKGILGMPLEILVMVIIAAVAITILVLWLSTGSGLDYIEVEAENGGSYPDIQNDITHGIEYTLTVTAYDSSDNTIQGATVRARGPGIDQTLNTNDNGEAEFTFTPNLRTNENTGTVEIDVEYTASGILGTTNTQSHTVPVNRN